MKILVFSDSHKDVDILVKVAANENADVICHCGDHLNDALELQKHIDVPIYFVAGNTDKAEANLYEKFVDIGDKRFMLVHGHQFDHGHKFYDSDEMFSHGIVKGGAEIILFGHTHQPFIRGYIEHESNSRDKRKWIFNPGSIRRSLIVPPTYGLIHIIENTDKIHFEIVQASEHLLGNF